MWAELVMFITRKEWYYYTSFEDLEKFGVLINLVIFGNKGWLSANQVESFYNVRKMTVKFVYVEQKIHE